MRLKPIYGPHDWVLAECSVCGKANYVPPYGTTAKCCMPEWTEHISIPYDRRHGGYKDHVYVDHKGQVK